MAGTTPSDKLNRQMQRYYSVERLLLMRGLSYGGAATCLVILVALTQVGAKDIGLKVSVISSSIALPIWFLLGSVYEYYIFLGKQSYSHLRTGFAEHFFGLLLLLAGLGSVCAVAGVIWFLMPEAAWLFGGAAIVAFALGVVYHVVLARWWVSAHPTDTDGDV